MRVNLGNYKYLAKDKDGIIYIVSYFNMLGETMIYTLESICKERDMYTYRILEKNTKNIVLQDYVHESMIEAFEYAGYEIIRRIEINESLKNFIDTSIGWH